MRNTCLVLIFVVSILSACGGGGDSPAKSNNSTSSVIPTAQPLSIYIGTWQNACNFHEQDTSIISMPNTTLGSLEVKLQTDYYDGIACTGKVVASSTLSANFTINYVKAIDTFVALNPSGGASALRVDQITASAPAMYTIMTGNNVQRRTTNGRAQWCISFSNGDSTCVYDDGMQAAANSQGAMYMRGNELYLLSPSTGGYSVDDKYTKK